MIKPKHHSTFTAYEKYADETIQTAYVRQLTIERGNLEDPELATCFLSHLDRLRDTGIHYERAVIVANIEVDVLKALRLKNKETSTNT